MKRIRINMPVAGLDFAWRPGQVVELEDAEAAKWADGVRADYVDGDAPPVEPEEPAEAEPPAEPAPEPPAGNASRDEWARFFADVLDVDPDEIKDLGRDALRDRYAAMDTEA